MAKIKDRYGNVIGEVESSGGGSGGDDGNGCLDEILAGIGLIMLILLLHACGVV